MAGAAGERRRGDIMMARSLALTEARASNGDVVLFIRDRNLRGMTLSNRHKA